jgi:hypothetical protein
MASVPIHRQPTARKWPPDARWRDHVCMFVVRDTRSCKLDAHEQLNRYPSNAYCCINWMLEEAAHCVLLLSADASTPRGAQVPSFREE